MESNNRWCLLTCVGVGLFVASLASWHPFKKEMPVQEVAVSVVPPQPSFMSWHWAPITPGPKVFPTTPVFEDRLLVTSESVRLLTREQRWQLASEKLNIIVSSLPAADFIADLQAHVMTLSIEPFSDDRVHAKFYLDEDGSPTIGVNVGYLLGARNSNDVITFWEVLVHEYQHFKQYRTSPMDVRFYFKGGDHTHVPCAMLLQGEEQAHWDASRWMLEHFGQCFDSDECAVVSDEVQFRNLVAELVIALRPECAGQVP